MNSNFGFAMIVDPIIPIVNLCYFFIVIIAIITTITVLIGKRKTPGYNLRFLVTGALSTAFSVITSFILIEIFAYFTADTAQSSYYRSVVYHSSSWNILYFHLLTVLFTTASVFYLYKRDNKSFATTTTIVLCVLFSLLLSFIPAMYVRQFIYEPTPAIQLRTPGPEFYSQQQLQPPQVPY